MGFSLIMLAVASFAITQAAPDCPPGKAEVTLITPGGKAVELCLPGQAVDAMIDAGVEVIEAVCPCFDTASIDAAARQLTDCGPTGPVPPLCEDVDEIITPGEDEDHHTLLQCRGPSESEDVSIHAWLQIRPFEDIAYCYHLDETSEVEIFISELSAAEVEACRAILRASQMWALNCGGS
jgi:hypothetical protein